MLLGLWEIEREREREQFSTISFLTKLRWIFFGKLPLERKYKPKILEYLFMLFSSILIFICELILLILIQNLQYLKNENTFLVNLVTKLKTFEVRILITILILSWIVQIFMSIHVFFILSKTEFNKTIALIAAISGIFLISPISLIFSLMAYQKNLLAFE
ncbi:hypothetical protein [Mesomycoplasma hyorhinis]|uniref:hypothetical protein n=1 Tax=Mesomycoplasma hyorhinis TaxID=2100 RepID=UPI001D1191F6|nr:hypothetical protein [Mesomycoplasma hyorhinis]